MLRSDKGTSIKLEVWAMPKAAFGSFLSGIASPLSIGTIELVDGTTAHGFLVEAAGVLGAEDITQFRDWRTYLSARDAELENSP
ncbi:MAG: hypothetical protein AAGA38_04115 [Pseudomonadota bacterium]